MGCKQTSSLATTGQSLAVMHHADPIQKRFTNCSNAAMACKWGHNIFLFQGFLLSKHNVLRRCGNMIIGDPQAFTISFVLLSHIEDDIKMKYIQ